MSDQALRINVEPGTLFLGGVLRGSVMILRELKGDLRVSLGYGGRRTRDREVAAVDAGSGRFDAGATVPFEVRIPIDAPHSFNGAGHSVEWWVKVVADVPWAFDPEARYPITVRPRQVSGRAQYVELSETLPRSRTPRLPIWRTLLGGLASLIAFALVSLFIPHMIACGILLLPVFFLIGMAKLIARTRVRHLRIEAPEGEALLGEWLPVRASFELRHPIEVEHVTLSLKGVETWKTSSGSGKNRRTTTHRVPFHEESLRFVGPGVIAPRARRARFEGHAAFRLPERGFPSRGGVSWTLELQVPVVGWPDPQPAEETLTVVSAVVSEQEPPAVPPLAETSPEVLVIPKGEPIPYEVDQSKLRERIYGWLVAPVSGLAMLIGGVIVDHNPELVIGTLNVSGQAVDIPHPGTMFAVGGLLLVGGGVALVHKLAR